MKVLEVWGFCFSWQAGRLRGRNQDLLSLLAVWPSRTPLTSAFSSVKCVWGLLPCLSGWVLVLPPAWFLGRVRGCWVVQKQEWFLPQSTPALDLDLTRISNACGLTTLGTILGIFVLYLKCVYSPAREPDGMYWKERKDKRNVDLHGRHLQRKRNVFSLADIVFMCF